MGCYLCAYQQTAQPKTVDPLPATSPVPPGDQLGTCWKCSVSACAVHATRYGRYECAICTPAVATLVALGIGRIPYPQATDPAAALARAVGDKADQRQLAGVKRGLARLYRDNSVALRRGAEERYRPAVPEQNIVLDLASVIRAAGADEFVPAVQTEDERGAEGGAGGVSLEAVAAVVRETLAGNDLSRANEEQVSVIAGALLLATAVADEPAAAAVEPGVGTVAVEPRRIELRPPWRMSHPALLDPLLWLIATAYSLPDAEPVE